MDCPHCESAPVETVRTAWFLQGLLLFARWGSRSYVGCTSCTRNKVLGSLALSSVLGWWCFPWGIGTPVVLLQNVASAMEGANRNALGNLLADQGVSLDELEVDADGRTPAQKALMVGVISVIHSMIWADGDADEREVDTGVDIARQTLGDLISASELRTAFLDPEAPPEPDLPHIPGDARVILMKAAATIAAADEVIEESEREELRALGRRLELPEMVADTLIASLDQPENEESEGVKQIAADTLGVTTSTPLAQVHQAYQAARLAAAELDEGEARAQHVDQLEWAYGVLTGGRVAA